MIFTLHLNPEPSIDCEFEDGYMCGYNTIGLSFVWSFDRPTDITYVLGPSTDSDNSLLGN